MLAVAQAAGIAAPLLCAQEDMPPAGRGGGQGGRGGRGGRGAPSWFSTMKRAKKSDRSSETAGRGQACPDFLRSRRTTWTTSRSISISKWNWPPIGARTGATYSTLRNQTSGDAARGEALFKTSCANCHSATGDLARIGAKFPQAAALQSRFLW